MGSYLDQVRAAAAGCVGMDIVVSSHAGDPGDPDINRGPLFEPQSAARHLSRNARPLESPPEYGWRLWGQTRDGGNLISFMSRMSGAHLRAESATVFANCPHGNTPAVPQCPCGIHFVEHFDTFHEQAKLNVSCTTSVRIATFGRAIGEVIEDLNPDESWGGARPWRSAGYEILGILTEPDIPNWQILRAIYRVPVITSGINKVQAARLLDGWRAS